MSFDIWHSRSNAHAYRLLVVKEHAAFAAAAQRAAKRWDYVFL